MASRGKLIDELVDDVTRSALGSANLSAEDRVLARQRLQQVIGTAAMQAHREVVAAGGQVPTAGSAQKAQASASEQPAAAAGAAAAAGPVAAPVVAAVKGVKVLKDDGWRRPPSR
ncbi:hypothetical protein AB0L70_14930 [Kribbella sp. NPDC051952]|uniref:hypothetical protein n=1 Tax=Kribbella sp. NPDC051952 TaxID=3154851 RepID=UPI0034430ED7